MTTSFIIQWFPTVAYLMNYFTDTTHDTFIKTGEYHYRHFVIQGNLGITNVQFTFVFVVLFPEGLVQLVSTIQPTLEVLHLDLSACLLTRVHVRFPQLIQVGGRHAVGLLQLVVYWLV